MTTENPLHEYGSRFGDSSPEQDAFERWRDSLTINDLNALMLDLVDMYPKEIDPILFEYWQAKHE